MMIKNAFARNMIKIIEGQDEDFALSLHYNVWSSLFDYIVNLIIIHCEKILKNEDMKSCKHIFCVGGFSQSKYFQKRLKDAFIGHKNGVHIIIPQLSHLCVVDGAVKYGLNHQFMKIRRLPSTYGIRISERKPVTMCKLTSQFIEAHSQVIKHFHTGEQNVEVVNNLFKIFVRKGEEISINDKPITHAFKKSNLNSEKVSVYIYSSDKVEPSTIFEGTK